MCDLLIEMMLQGYYAAFGVGTPTALPVLAQARGILQGLAETDQHFAARLQQWLTYWYDAGSAEMLGFMLQNFIPGSPTIIVWERSGRYTITYSPTASQPIREFFGAFGNDPNWNWDSVSNPERAGWWSDIWIVVYPDPYADWELPLIPETGWSNPAAAAQWASGGPQGLGIGHQVPRILVDGVLSIISTWKGAHTYVEAIIWTTAPLSDISTPFAGMPYLFCPTFLTTFAGNPDGTWGNWGKFSGGMTVASRTRETTLSGVTYHTRYWIPPGGG
jgi:hypothetical protein